MRVAYPYTRLNETVVREVLSGEAYPLPPLNPDTTIRSIADIGAHIGTAAVWFHHHWPQAAIHCFEPTADSVDLLRTNAPFATIHPYALTNRNGQAAMVKPPLGAVLNSLKAGEGESEIIECRSAALLHDLQPDLIKLDTEGCEIEIIETALAAFQQAKVIYIEFHRWEDRLKIEELLAAVGPGPQKILFSAKVNWSLNRGELGYIDRAAVNKKALTQWAL
jgi:FkbM family methyltransferase